MQNQRVSASYGHEETSGHVGQNKDLEKRGLIILLTRKELGTVNILWKNSPNLFQEKLLFGKV